MKSPKTHSYCPVLDGYENLAKDATVKVGDTTNIKELTDLNLETKLSACTANQACEIELTLAHNPSGIYKVIVYGPTETSDVSGWEAKIKLEVAAPGSANDNTEVDCQKDTTSSTGTDSFTFKCDADRAATKVIVKTTSYKDLAEIIVAGHDWTKFPCPPGRSSATGSYSTSDGTTCKPCTAGSYQDLPGQKFCRPSKFEKTLLTDEKKNTYQDAKDDFSMSSELKGGVVHDVVVYNINFDDYSSGAESTTSSTETTAKGSCANTLASYQKTADTLCVLKVKDAKVILLRTDKTEIESHTLTDQDNTGTSKRDQTYTYKPSSPVEGVKKVSFSQSFLLAELRVYEATSSDYFDRYNNVEGAIKAEECPKDKVASGDFTSCVLCKAGTERPGETVECKECDVGKYRGANDENGCKPCVGGSVAKEKGLATCTLCDKGKKENGQKTDCVACDAGTVTKETGQTVCKACSEEGELFYANSDQSDCLKCADGKVPNTARTECVDCDPGQYRSSDKTACENCPAPQISASAGSSSCTDCDVGKKPNAGRTACEDCPAGQYRGQSDTGCLACSESLQYSGAGSASCSICGLGKVHNSARSGCEDCEEGMYRGQPQTECTVCEGGHHTDGQKGQEKCVKCPEGQETQKIGGADSGLQCVACKAGFYSSAEGTATCTECESPNVSLATGQSTCTKCEAGTGHDSSSSCRNCVAGEKSLDGLCKPCSYNEITENEKATECTRCPKHYHSAEGASVCSMCEGEYPEEDMKDKNELQWQKCVADLGPACEKQNVESVYGTFENIKFMRAGSYEIKNCPGKYSTTPVPTANFSCEAVSETEAVIKPRYNCIKTPKTENIEKLAEEGVTGSNTDLVSSRLEAYTKGGGNGIGDVEAAADVLEKIAEATTTVSETATVNLVSAVSSLAGGDLKTEDVAKKREISKKMVENIKQIVRKTAVTNKLVRSANLAVMKVSTDTNAENKGISFFLPDAKDLTKLDQAGEESRGGAGGGAGGGDSTAPAIAIQSSAAADMSVVILTGDAFFPSEGTGEMPEGTKAEVRDTLWEDLKDDFNPANSDSGSESLKYVNSVVLEIDVGKQEPGFVLNLYIKPNFQVGDTAESLTQIDNRRVQIRYLCAWYEPYKAEWVTDGCVTIYDSSAVETGVVCSCTHNTSFAVLMAAEEIDPGYVEAQSLMSQILLGGSIFGLIATIGLILPASAIVTTRSAKVNICFSIALLLASLLFILQDALIKGDNSGVIQLKSIGCAVYTMLQHYMWLVVFMWTVIEGFLMYLSLVQVFGSHISHYMLKFNALAYGVPIVFPIAGYFAFTRQVTVAGVEVTDHQYMADTMCFLKPGTINFYVLFFGPLVLAILVNLVFFALVLKVIRKSKNSSLSDKEQLLRQMKAAVGVMVLLGTGWVIGVFMNIPAPGLQITLQYLFIVINASQGMFVFVFYVVLNDAVKNFWLEKFGLKSAAPKSGAGASSATNVYANASASKQDTEHTYSNAAEFPAKKDDNANL